MVRAVDTTSARAQLRVESSAAGSPSAGSRSLPLHVQEKLLIGLVAGCLITLAWGLGGMAYWVQCIGLALAAASFVVALWPRTYFEPGAAGRDFRLILWPRLLRFPLFWIGLIYVAFVAVQALNPAWRFMRSDQGWWIEPIEYVTWLPHGVEGTPLLKMNAWRALTIHSTTWLLVCAIWVGFTRRKSARVLLWTIGISGVTLALLGLLQRLTGSTKMFWAWRPPFEYYFGTFLYKNHAGAYLNLIVATCAGLAWWHAERAHRRLQKSHPGMLLLFLALLTFAAVVFTFSRAAAALGLGLLLILIIGYAVRISFRARGGTPPLVTSLMAVFFVGFLGLAAYSLNIEQVIGRFGRLLQEDQSAAIEYRKLATQAAIDMGQDSPWVGHGVGEFRYVFPRYQYQYPLIFTEGKRRLYWEFAHNDYAQLFAEAGWFGVSLAAATLIYLLAASVRHGVFSRPAKLALLGGPLVVLLHAAMDFPFGNPAILVTTAALIVVTLRWTELERGRGLTVNGGR